MSARFFSAAPGVEAFGGSADSEGVEHQCSLWFGGGRASVLPLVYQIVSWFVLIIVRCGTLFCHVIYTVLLSVFSTG